MNNNTENTQNTKIGHDGRQWTTIGPKASYDECIKITQRRSWIEDQDNHDIKIKKLSDGFYIKVREKQSSIDRRAKIEENQKKLQAEQKSEKKKNKELNKRQRD